MRRSPRVAARKPSARNEPLPRPCCEVAPPPCCNELVPHPCFEFLYKVTCAECLQPSRPLKHTLCFTSLLFLVPASSLFEVGEVYVGSCTAALSMTSLAYHATHDCRVRAMDVLLLWFTACLGVGKTLVAMVVSGPSAILVTGLLAALSLSVIFGAPACYVEGTEMIRLPWHGAVHSIGAASLLCLAMGLPGGGEEAARETALRHHAYAWLCSAGGAVALVACSCVFYAAAGPSRRAWLAAAQATADAKLTRS